MIPFRVFKVNNALKIAVEVGFVVGTTAAITPIGSAILVMPNDLSYSITHRFYRLCIDYKYILKQNGFLLLYLLQCPFPFLHKRL